MGHVISKVGSVFKPVVHVITHPIEDIKNAGKDIAKVANDVKDVVGSATHAVVHVITHPEQDVDDVVSGVKQVVHAAKNIGKATLHVIEHPGDAERFVGEVVKGVGDGVLHVIMHPQQDIDKAINEGEKLGKSYIHTLTHPFSNVHETLHDIKTLRKRVKQAKKELGELVDAGAVDVAVAAGNMLQHLSEQVAVRAKESVALEQKKKEIAQKNQMLGPQQYALRLDPLRQTISSKKRSRSIF